MNLKKEDVKRKAVKIFNLVQNIAEKLAIHLILDIKKIKADKLKIKQLDSRITKQQSIGSRIKKKTFPNEEIIFIFMLKISIT